MGNADGTPAIVLANGVFGHTLGKTAHGLVRASRRFRVTAVVDPDRAGEDAGEVVDGHPRGIPIVASLADALEDPDLDVEVCVMGIATPGGYLPPSIVADLATALRAGLDVVSGLHEPVMTIPVLDAAARETNANIIELRRPRPTSELRSWSGEIHTVRALRLAVLGTDSAIGKRTTATVLCEALERSGIPAELIYTGQTGYLQGFAHHGLVLDATINDFVSGELERAIVECDRMRSPEVIVIEGQSGLRSPAGPGGPVLIRSGAVHGVVLQHKPSRTYFFGLEGNERYRIGPVATDVELVRAYGTSPIAVTVNAEGLSATEAEAYVGQTEAELGIPVTLPLADRGARLASIVSNLLSNREELPEASA